MAFLKKKKPKVKKFIARIDPEVDKKVEQALTLAEQGRLETAEKIVFELFEENSDMHTVQYAMGIVRGMKGLTDEAIDCFDRAIDIFPYFTEAWFNKAIAHLQKLEIIEMIRAYQRVIELGDPEDFFVEEAKERLAEFEQQICKDSGISLARYVKGNEKFDEAFAAMEREEWSVALRRFKEVLALNPGHTQSYGNMGICYAKLGHKAEALKAFDKALELDPEYEPAKMNRKLVSSLKDGEKIKGKMTVIEFHKDFPQKTK